jgi:hypothetical protein
MKIVILVIGLLLGLDFSFKGIKFKDIHLFCEGFIVILLTILFGVLF